MPISVSFNLTEYALLQEQLDTFYEVLPLMYATELHRIISVYPNYSPARQVGKTYYQRGMGTVYVKKSGGVTKRRVSEMLGRKWDIVKGKQSALLRNKASYSAYVHISDYQAKIHYKRGWENEETAMAQIDENRLINAAMRAIK